MKERKALEDLVHKVSAGTATDEEKAVFSEWMLHLDLSPADMQNALTDKLRAAMLEDILSTPVKEIPHTSGRLYRLPAIKYASLAAAVLILTVGLFVLWQQMRPAAHLPADLTVIPNIGRDVRHAYLPDSTEVWLNNGSILSFSEQDYTTRERHVSLKGEGYFKVARNTKPFVVSAGGVDTRVLGTAFNIENYPRESEVRVTLVQGKVSVGPTSGGTTILTPDQMAHFPRHKPGWAVDHTDASQVIEWINGHLVFHELPLSEALGRMEDRYGILFRYDSALLAGKNVTGNFGIRPWQQVLDDLLFVHMLTYHQKNGVIYITKQ